MKMQHKKDTRNDKNHLTYDQRHEKGGHAH